MKLPRADRAFVEREKIVEYLLNPAHRYGATRARFFEAFGFRVEQWEVLARALRTHGQDHEVTEVHDSEFGLRYEVEGPLQTPDGRRPLLRTVWQQENDAVGPRLITAYPLEERA
ncbi:MAG TPA: hypothetical protein PLO37_14950 [Candidatus Hydrogenedentes bacterium]|nr:hypothetical protein [Candidatus Hydrogenedentota bacterium]HPG68145.1 hypothetical protein [Candidatus Hydrogenedentota bacterium]